MRTLVWFRNDLRVSDNPALLHAMERGEAVAAFCVCTRQWRAHDVGDNRFGFVLDSLDALARDLQALHVPLRLITEPWFDGVPRRLVKLAGSIGADSLAFDEEFPLNERHRDAAVARACEAAGIAVHIHHANALLPPGSVLTRQGAPFVMFTPFKRQWLQRADPSVWTPLPRPSPQPPSGVEGSRLPRQIDGVDRRRVADLWPGGSAEAERRLEHFIELRIDAYHRQRDIPGLEATSRLSPYLSVGCVSARQCLAAAVGANDGRLASGRSGAVRWIDELIWRDFYRHVAAQIPRVSRGLAFRPQMDRVPWRSVPSELLAWQEGRTGFPLVDAAMRQLTATGWMHNRLRMLTAMFLSKLLLLDWRLGERHFMNLLVDGDFAANNGGWQWSASTGTDSAPYFRIFNPFAQARRFDPEGVFIRRWVPELSGAPDAALFDPVRHNARGYPRPIIDYAAARRHALETFGRAGGR